MDAVTDKLRTTFVQDDPDGAQRRTVADQPVVIYKPTSKTGGSQRAAGLTFVITAVSMPLSKYTSIIEALLSLNHVVVGIYVNSLTTEQHRTKAERIPQIFAELSTEGGSPTRGLKKYGIVGHSIGAKIALLTAALYDEERDIATIIALDPVDQSPPEFTNAPLTSGKKGRDNLKLKAGGADITLTCTDSGYWIKKAHNARGIHNHNPATKLIMHRNTPHMVYCDDDGVISWKALMGAGKSPDRNAAVKAETLALVKEKGARSTLPALTRGTSGKITSVFGKAKKAVQSNIDELKELGGDAKKKGNAFAMSANIAKVTSGM